MVVYCTVVNMMIEIFLSGMTFEQSLSSRLGGDPGQHYYCRTLWDLSRFRHASGPAHQPGRWMKNMADVLAYVTFSRRCMSLFCGAWVLTGTRLSPR
ncbi:L-alanine exporter AlaE [Klebsiella pneumoniae subsp. pneumoniae]|nr:L-alanine exporter AlaE [Klebsiella pneumoniae subsp. pneumoniae]